MVFVQHAHHGHPLFWLLCLVILLLADRGSRCGSLVRLAGRATRRPPRRRRCGLRLATLRSSSVRLRYASGEIDRDEFVRVSTDLGAPPCAGVEPMRRISAVKLHRCSYVWVKIDGHPCWRVQKALDEAGVDYEVVRARTAPARDDLERLSGQRLYPVIEFEDGSIYREQSKEMAARIRAGKLMAHAPAPTPGRAPGRLPHAIGLGSG